MSSPGGRNGWWRHAWRSSMALISSGWRTVRSRPTILQQLSAAAGGVRNIRAPRAHACYRPCARPQARCRLGCADPARAQVALDVKHLPHGLSGDRGSREVPRDRRAVCVRPLKRASHEHEGCVGRVAATACFQTRVCAVARPAQPNPPPLGSSAGPPVPERLDRGTGPDETDLRSRPPALLQAGGLR